MISFNFQATTGIYIGQKDVYAVQLKRTLFGVRLVRFGKAEIQTKPQEEQPDKEKTQAVVEAVKRVIRENNISSKKVFTALAGKDTLIRYFQMPRIPKPEWETAIKFEAKKYMPFKIEDLAWDYQVSLSKDKGNKMDVTFIAVKKETAKNYILALEQAGLKPIVLEPAPFSLLRLFTLGNQITKDKPVAIIDVDYGLADINIVKGKICYLTRDVSLPLEEEAIFDSLLNEVGMSLDYYEKLFPVEAVSKILLCGEVELKDWDKKLEEELKIPVNKADIARAIKIQKVLPPLNMAIAIGLALRGTIATTKEVNLYRVRATAPKPALKTTLTKEALKFTPEIRISVYRAATMSFVGLLILHLVMFRGVAKERKQLDALVSLRPTVESPVDTSSYSELEKLRKELQGRLSVLKLVIDKRILWTSKFNELPKIIPPGIWLTGLSFSEHLPRKAKKISRSFVIRGVAYHEDTAQEIGMITKFVANMNTNKKFLQGFEKFKLDSMTSADFERMAVKKFTISSTIK